MDLTEHDMDPEGRLHQNLWIRLREADWTPDILTALVDSADEVEALLGCLWPALQGNELAEQKAALWEAIQRADRLRRRKIRKMVGAVGQPRLEPGGSAPSTAEVYATSVSENVELSRSVWKKRTKRKIMEK